MKNALRQKYEAVTGISHTLQYMRNKGNARLMPHFVLLSCTLHVIN